MTKTQPITHRRQVFDAMLNWQGVFSIKEISKAVPHIPKGTISGAVSVLLPPMLEKGLIRRDFTRKDDKRYYYETMVPLDLLSQKYLDQEFASLGKPTRKPKTNNGNNNRILSNPGPDSKVGKTLIEQQVIKVNNNTLIEINIWSK